MGIIEICLSNVWRSVCTSSQSHMEEWANTSRIACEQMDLEAQGKGVSCGCVLCGCVMCASCGCVMCQQVCINVFIYFELLQTF